MKFDDYLLAMTCLIIYRIIKEKSVRERRWEKYFRVRCDDWNHSIVLDSIVIKIVVIFECFFAKCRAKRFWMFVGISHWWQRLRWCWQSIQRASVPQFFSTVFPSLFPRNVRKPLVLYASTGFVYQVGKFRKF